MQLAANAPTPPARGAAPRVEAPRAEDDAEGDGDNVERDPPAPMLEAVRHVVKREARPAPIAANPAPAPAAAAPVRVASNNPAAAGWVKGPDAAPQAAKTDAAPTVKATTDAKSAAAAKPATVATLAPPARGEKTPAALGWVKGPEAAAPAEQKAAPAKAAAVARPKEETPVAKSEDVRPARDGWMIQIGATDDAGKANDLLIRAKAQNRSTLARQALYEKVEKGAGTFYRARFAGLNSSSAETACKSLEEKRFFLLRHARLKGTWAASREAASVQNVIYLRGLPINVAASRHPWPD